MQHSESLLTEILLLLQRLNGSVSDFREELDTLKKKNEEIEKKVSEIVEFGFGGMTLKDHSDQHRTINRGSPTKRLFLWLANKS